MHVHVMGFLIKLCIIFVIRILIIIGYCIATVTDVGIKKFETVNVSSSHNSKL